MERTELDALPPGALIGERYEVTRVLGRGGMATVYACRDEATSRQVAVKQLQAVRAQDEHLVRLFEREFHTLAQLAHPRVVEVYDYQTSAGSPFYTMELLDGDDLREQQVLLPWKAVCAILGDVCSALSLLHSRRFVHRDVTPRNIRAAGDGKAKLIDFGAMVPFGTHKRTVGTPAFTAPEAVTGQPLDGRADLFSLGATAYYALTGRHAYPARSFDKLRNLWRTEPALPSRYAPGIPPDLDQLVMWLLSLAPSRRPASAAAVIERLTAIAGLVLDEQVQVQRAFLTTPSLVGRDAVLQQVRRQVILASRGRGSTAFLSGATGVGRSRMVDACALEGKLANAVVLRADAGDAQSGDWGGVRSLLDQLLAELPAKAPELIAVVAPALAHVWPRALELLGAAPNDVAHAHVERSAVQRALLALIDAVTRQAFLMITADDVEQLDEPTRAFLALLAQQVTGRRLFLVSAAVSGSVEETASGRELLRSAAATHELAALSAEETERLLLSVFGEAPNVRLLASRLQSASGGVPAAAMQLTQHLLDRQVIGFRDGAWLLPSTLDRDALPTSISTVLQARLRELDAASVELAQAIALSRKSSVTGEDCVCLAAASDFRAVLGSLDVLSRAGVVQAAGDRYVLQPGWAAVLLAELDAARSRELHAKVGRLFMREPAAEFKAAAHLLASDAPEAAIEQVLKCLERTTRELADQPARLPEFMRALPTDWMQTLDAAIAAAERLGRPRRQRLQLRQLALRLPNATEPRPEIARALTEQLYVDSGLSDYADIDSSVPSAERITRALQLAQARYAQTPEHDRCFEPGEAIAALAQAELLTVVMMAASADAPFLQSLPSLAPYAPLSAVLAIVQRDLECTCHLLSGRYEQAHAGYLEILAQLATPGGVGLPPISHRYLELAIIYGVALVETLVGQFAAAALRIEVLEREPMFEVNAWRLRMIQALRQGNLEGAAVCERKAELLKIRNAPSQFFEGSDAWHETIAYAEIGDVARIRQTLEPLDVMARRFETWALAPLFARGNIALLRGESQAAVECFERAVTSAEAGVRSSWVYAARGYLMALAQCGRVEQARARGAVMLEQARAGGLTAQIGELHFAMASVELAAGEHAAALTQLEALARTRERWPGGAVFGGACDELRARVAIGMSDQPAFELAATACAGAFLASRHPILIARHARLLQDAERAGLRSPTARISPPADAGDDETAAERTATRRTHGVALAQCSGREARIERVLTLVSEAGVQGHAMLYLPRSGELVCVGTRGACPDRARMDGLVRSFLSEELEAASQASGKNVDADDLITSTVDSNDWAGPTGVQFAPALLSHTVDGELVITGVLVFDIESQHRPADDLLEQLSQALTVAGDVEPIRVQPKTG